MGLLPSNPMVHRRVMVRAFTSLISISGGSGGSVQSTRHDGGVSPGRDARRNAEGDSRDLGRVPCAGRSFAPGSCVSQPHAREETSHLPCSHHPFPQRLQRWATADGLVGHSSCGSQPSETIASGTANVPLPFALGLPSRRLPDTEQRHTAALLCAHGTAASHLSQHL